jgi:hypothetical protein
MLFVVFIIVFLLASLLTGGRLSYISGHSVRFLWMPILAYALRFALPILMPRVGLAEPSELVTCCAQYALLVIFSIANLRRGLWSAVFGIGALSNFAVILANGGVMPVAVSALARLSEEYAKQLIDGSIFAYAVEDARTKLMPLGDIIYIYFGYASVGDVLLSLGAGMFCWHMTRKPKK